MTKPKHSQPEESGRRQLAKEIARRKAAQTLTDLETMSHEEMRRILRELQTHQIELELQNEKLHQAQAALGASQAHDIEGISANYQVLFEHMTQGAFFQRADGTLIDVNSSALRMFGLTRDEVLARTSLSKDWDVVKEDGSPFPGPEHPSLQALQTGAPVYGVVAGMWNPILQKRVWMEVNAIPKFHPGDSKPFEVLVTLHDITERRQWEQERELSLQLLTLINSQENLQELMRAVTCLLRDSIGCAAVGIRLQAGEDFPYFETTGFPAAFVQTENKLCTTDKAGELVRDDQGNPMLQYMCGQVLCSRFDPGKPFFTARGSFWTNSTTQLLATSTEADRQARNPNRCSEAGFESVALIAIRAGGKVFGLLQCNDPKPGCFTPEQIHLLERLADHLAIALAHRRAEEELLQSEARFQAIATYTANWENWFGLDGRLLWVNPAVERFIGYTVAECLSQPDFPLGWVLEADQESFRQQLESMRLGSRGEKFEFRIIHKDGQVKWCAMAWQPIFDPAGQALGCRSSVRDITERKQLENRLCHFASIVQSSDDAIVGKDLDGNILSWNRAAERIYGYPAQEIVGRSISILVPPNRTDELPAILARLLRGESVQHFETIRLRKDGLPIHVSLTVSPMYDASGRVVGASTIARDITERKQAEMALREGERFAHATIDSLTAHLCVLDESGTILAVNQAWRRFATNNSPTLADLCEGSNYLSVCDTVTGLETDDARKVSAGIRAIVSQEQDEFMMEYPCHSPSEDRWFIGRITRFQGPGQTRLVVAHENITERKRAEAALRESEEQFRAVAQAATDAIISIDSVGKVVFWNRTATAMLGWPAGEIEGRQIETIIPVDFRMAHVRGLAQAVTFGSSTMLGHVVELDALHQEGGLIPVELSLSRWETRTGVFFTAILRDIRERRRLESEREKARDDYQMLFTRMIDGFALHEILCNEAGEPVDYRFLAINPAFEQLTGLKAELVLGRTVKEVLPQIEPFWIEKYGRVALTGEPVFFEHGDRALERWYKVSAFSPAPKKFACVFVDVTDRKRAEERLQESERRLRLALESAGLGMWDWNLRSGKIIWSEGHARLFGLKPEEFDGRYETFQRCVHPEDLAKVEAALEQARVLRTEYVLEHRVRWPDGSEHWIMGRGHFMWDGQGEPFRMLGVVQDFTQRKQMEAQFQQAQKMEAVGQLAGGVAHDFNNILAATMMNLSLLEQDPNLTVDMRESIKELAHDAKRAASLTRQLLVFSRRQIAQRKVLNWNEVVDNLLRMLRRLLGEHIELLFREGRTPLWIEADPGMVEQVVMNLCVNARDAMPQGGRLILSTRQVEVDAVHVQRNPEAREGGFAMLAVEDEGCGMDEATLKRIFEPFFTTKGVGKGTGLGLATVYGIVKQHEGWVEVESQLNEGTLFRVYLPLVNKAAETPVQKSGQAQATGGSETILLVEDEPGLRRTIALFLRYLGYAVWEASNGVEAMGLWQQHQDRIQLLFTDMVMPEGMTGLDLAEQLRAQKPGLKVIISSGYSVDLLGQSGQSAEGITYVPKPCAPDALAQVVRKCLEPKSEPTP